MINYELPPLDYKKMKNEICGFIQKHVKGKDVVVGLSGGVDSAAVAALSVKALGRERVLALIMPAAGVTPKTDTDDAMRLAGRLGIEYRIIDITESSKCIVNSTHCSGNKVAEGNINARLRMLILYYIANLDGRIVIGSGDRSELLIGYFTKYGDGGVDLQPIGGLYKTQVRELAKSLGVPSKITDKKSSPHLWPDQTAEGELGLRYEDIDVILHLLVDKGYRAEKISEILGSEKMEAIIKVRTMMIESRHKRRVPAIPRPQVF